MAIRWGIAGTGKISHDFIIALRSSLTERKHSIVAVASQNHQRASEFAEKFEIPKSYGSYEDLAKDEDVDIVYVAVLNPLHFHVCITALNLNKHILCEKPFCMNSVQVKKVLDLAKSQELFAIEGLWSRFFPVYEHLRKLLDNGDLGDVKEVHINHGFEGENTPRIVDKNLGGGIVLDIGVYAIQFVLFCFKDDPVSIHASGKTNKNGVDLCFEAKIKFPKGKFAKIKCSGMEKLENIATIVGTKGTVTIPDYWCPTSITGPNSVTETWWLPETDPKMNFLNSCGLKYEADAVAETILAGKPYPEQVRPIDMLMIALVEDEIRRQIGVRYDTDKP